MRNDERPTWPRRFPLYRAIGLLLALACGATVIRIQILFLSPLKRFYLRTYLTETVAAQFPTISFHKGATPQPKAFPVAFVGRFVATEDLLTNPVGSLRVALLNLEPKSFLAWLATHIYDGKDLAHIFYWPLVGTGICFLAFVGCGAALDRSRNLEARNGRLLRGPALLSPWRFNLRTRGNGLAFHLHQPNPLLRLLAPRPKICIQRDREAHHIQVAGDTGSGKSTIVRDILYQVEQREETAIIFDPDREYIKEFYEEARGDWVLNPKDDRCPYWPIGEECDDEATATPIANGLFPNEPTLMKFFLDHTRSIFAYLLASCRPSTADLAYWMAHPEEIDKRVKGTEHEHTLTANAAPQRAGILGSMNAAGRPLRMMPTTDRGRRTWMVRLWAKERKGWIFITSTPDTLDALRPLQSLWLDMLILKLQTAEKCAGQKRVWMILDELAALNALPQLQSALTRQRKSDNPIVLGFQGMAQLDKLYGKDAETILSQAYTNIVLRTREPRAADHLSKLIGSAQLERVTESRPAHWFGNHSRHSYSTQRVVDPVVMQSELQGLKDLSGYFVQEDKVVAIEFRPRPKRVRADGLIERIIPAAPYSPDCESEDPEDAHPEEAPMEQGGFGISLS